MQITYLRANLTKNKEKTITKTERNKNVINIQH